MVKKADLRQKALKERNIDSMLEDAKNDNKDTDAEHLQRRCELTQLLFNKSNSLTATGAALMPTLISHIHTFVMRRDADKSRVLHTPGLLKFIYLRYAISAEPFTTDPDYNCDEESVELNYM